VNWLDQQNQYWQPRLTAPQPNKRSPAFNFDVWEPASLPEQPVSPDRFKMAAGGFIAGLILAAAIAIIRRIRVAPAMRALTPNA
jgi:uncharacterized protein involved in exopolysaccharide biosynthesis